jgi:hypothetical protein
LQPPVADIVLGRPYVYEERLETLIKEKGLEKAIRQHSIDIVDIACLLGHDLIYAVPNPLPVSVNTAERRESIPPLDDPVEEMMRRIKNAEENLCKPKDERFLVYKFIKEEMKNRGLDLPIFAPDYFHGVWTDTVLMQTMILAPEVASKHFSLATKKAFFSLEKYLGLNIDIIGVGGDFAGNRGPMVSPDLYRKFIVPEVCKLSNHIRSSGKVSVNASDGNLWPVINDFLIGCKVDGYIEIDFRADMELSRLKKEFGDKVTFFGNLDCANFLSFGTVEQIKQHTKDCLKDGMGNGGHILCCNNAITSSIPTSNYMAIYDAYKEFFGIDGKYKGNV